MSNESSHSAQGPNQNNRSKVLNENVVLGKVEVQFASDLVSQYRASNEEQSKYNKRASLVSWLTLVVVAIYTVVSWLQWHSAQKANELTQQSLRARIVFQNAKFSHPVVAGQPIQIMFDYKNVGHAEGIYGLAVGSIRSRGLHEGDIPLTISERDRIIEADAFVNGELHDGELPSQEFLNGIPAWDESSNGKLTTYFMGELIYESFGREYKTAFCTYLAKRQGTRGNYFFSNQYEGGDYVVMKCPQGNYSH